MEKWIQKYFAAHPERIEPGLELVAQQVAVDCQGWLGAEPPGPAWDRYTHRRKGIDLVFRKGGKLVLCELKWGGGEADSAAPQLLDYWMMLKHDADARQLLPVRDLDFDRDVDLWLVVGGHVSQLCVRRLEYLRPEYRRLIRVFRAVPDRCPPDETCDWRCEPVEPPPGAP